MGKYTIGVGAQIRFDSKGCSYATGRICQVSFNDGACVSLIVDGTNGSDSWTCWSGDPVKVEDISDISFEELKKVLLVGEISFVLKDFSLKVGARWENLTKVFAGGTK